MENHFIPPQTPRPDDEDVDDTDNIWEFFDDKWNPTMGVCDEIDTVVGEALAVFRLPKIRKNCQCLDGQVGKNFLEIFGGNYIFLKFREAMNALFFTNFWIFMNFSSFSRFLYKIFSYSELKSRAYHH